MTNRPPGGGGPAGPKRCVIHADMDAFFAAVEAKEDPSLAGLPVVVGGSGARGVVASASYEARAYGVCSAMPGARARRLCPELIFLPPRFSLYQAYSERFHEVLRSFTPLVEGIGLDEAFLDVSSGGGLFGPPLTIAAQLRERVLAELGIGCSVGAGPNKLVAKLASKTAKPHPSMQGPRPGQGTMVVTDEEVPGFIWPMPVEALWGVGPASAAKLHNLGVTTVGQLAALPCESVISAFGKASGQLLHSLAWGQDPRPVVAERAVKSISHEETYPEDVLDREELERRLVAMADSVAARTRRQGALARTVTLKLRYGDFTTLTRSHTFDSPHASGPVFWTAAKALLSLLELGSGVRLLGLSASGLVPAESSPGEQLQLALGAASAGGPTAGPAGRDGTGRDGTGRDGTGWRDAGGHGWAKANDALDAVRARFGPTAVGPAASLPQLGRRPEAGAAVLRGRDAPDAPDD